MSDLTEQERNQIIDAIRTGRPLPARYRASLFEDALESELIWPGKTTDTEKVVLPFQSIEHIDEPRSETVVQPTLFSVNEATGRQAGGWTNKLIWGDNRLILSALVAGPQRAQIEDAGGLGLVYIDPPFDVGADWSIEVEIGGEEITKIPSLIEEIAYRDTWGRGVDSFAAMLSERLRLMHSLLSQDGVLLVHCDWRTSAIVRLIGDEIFGAKLYRNEIVWSYRTGGAGRGTTLPRKHDVIHVWAKALDRGINSLTERQYLEKAFMGSQIDSQGRHYVDTILRDVLEGVVNVVTDEGEVEPISVRPVLNLSSERLGYPTQKPEGLIEVLLRIFAKPGTVVGDFFCGSGTTLAVAEKLGYSWIGADIGRFAVHSARKRLINVQRARAETGEAYRAFEILNLGAYERQYLAGVDLSLPPAQRAADSLERQHKYLSLVLQAYGAERSDQFADLHGFKGSAGVVVGPTDAAVTESSVRTALECARANGLTRVDVLGFEFEMGVTALLDEAREQGVTLALRYIPHEVFDQRAIAKGQVRFFDLGYLEVRPRQDREGSVTVELVDFGVFYTQEDADVVAAGLRPGKSKVIVDQGQVVRVMKDKAGTASREVLTRTWLDWVDYWAVDFNFESQREIVSVSSPDGLNDVWTGRYIFENQWQDFRTRGRRTLSTTSAPHRYDTPGEYRLAVKVVDVFGNDTTKVLKFRVK